MKPDHHLLPVASVACGIATFSLMDMFMKSASIGAGVYMAMLCRGIIGCLIMLPVWLARGGHLPGRDELRMHLLRAAVVVCMALLFFWGLVRMPMAEAIALSFVAPLVALYLAAVLLKERIGRGAILASALCLAGVAVIAAGRLSSESGDGRSASALGIAAVLVSSLLYAWNLILQRQQALLARAVNVALFQTMFVTGFLLLAAPWLAQWPDGPLLREATAAAGLAMVSLVLLSWGYARAEAQVLVPVEYSGFVWAALFGWLWFGEQLTPATLAGAVLVGIGSSIAARRPRGLVPGVPPAP